MGKSNQYKKTGRKGNAASWWKHMKEFGKRLAHKKGRQEAKRDIKEQ